MNSRVPTNPLVLYYSQMNDLTPWVLTYMFSSVENGYFFRMFRSKQEALVYAVAALGECVWAQKSFCYPCRKTALCEILQDGSFAE